jgi:hypothetical protein
MFSNSQLRDIEQIVNLLQVDSRAVMKIKGAAHEFFINHAQNQTLAYNLTTEAWVNAVVQYLMATGYEIKKSE